MDTTEKLSKRRRRALTVPTPQENSRGDVKRKVKKSTAASESPSLAKFDVPLLKRIENLIQKTSTEMATPETPDSEITCTLPTVSVECSSDNTETPTSIHVISKTSDSGYNKGNESSVVLTPTGHCDSSACEPRILCTDPPVVCNLSPPSPGGSTSRSVEDVLDTTPGVLDRAMTPSDFREGAAGSGATTDVSSIHAESEKTDPEAGDGVPVLINVRRKRSPVTMETSVPEECESTLSHGPEKPPSLPTDLSSESDRASEGNHVVAAIGEETKEEAPEDTTAAEDSTSFVASRTKRRQRPKKESHDENPTFTSLKTPGDDTVSMATINKSVAMESTSYVSMDTTSCVSMDTISCVATDDPISCVEMDTTSNVDDNLNKAMIQDRTIVKEPTTDPTQSGVVLNLSEAEMALKMSGIPQNLIDSIQLPYDEQQQQPPSREDCRQKSARRKSRRSMDFQPAQIPRLSVTPEPPVIAPPPDAPVEEPPAKKRRGRRRSADFSLMTTMTVEFSPETVSELGESAPVSVPAPRRSRRLRRKSTDLYRSTLQRHLPPLLSMADDSDVTESADVTTYGDVTESYGDVTESYGDVTESYDDVTESGDVKGSYGDVTRVAEDAAPATTVTPSSSSEDQSLLDQALFLSESSLPDDSMAVTTYMDTSAVAMDTSAVAMDMSSIAMDTSEVGIDISEITIDNSTPGLETSVGDMTDVSFSDSILEESISEEGGEAGQGSQGSRGRRPKRKAAVEARDKAEVALVRTPTRRGGGVKRKHEPSLEDIYRNKLWKEQMPREKTWETIFENPHRRGGRELTMSAAKVKRYVNFDDAVMYAKPRLKRRRQKAMKMGWKPMTRKKIEDAEVMVMTKILALDEALKEFEEPHDENPSLPPPPSIQIKETPSNTPSVEVKQEPPKPAKGKLGKGQTAKKGKSTKVKSSAKQQAKATKVKAAKPSSSKIPRPKQVTSQRKSANLQTVKETEKNSATAHAISEAEVPQVYERGSTITTDTQAIEPTTNITGSQPIQTTTNTVPSSEIKADTVREDPATAEPQPEAGSEEAIVSAGAIVTHMTDVHQDPPTSVPAPPPATTEQLEPETLLPSLPGNTPHVPQTPGDVANDVDPTSEAEDDFFTPLKFPEHVPAQTTCVPMVTGSNQGDAEPLAQPLSEGEDDDDEFMTPMKAPDEEDGNQTIEHEQTVLHFPEAPSSADQTLEAEVNISQGSLTPLNMSDVSQEY